MQTKDFYFELPDSLIAQHPSSTRGEDKLMRLNRVTGEVSHFAFADLPRLIEKGTVMVFNNSRVRRSRVYARVLQSNDETVIANGIETVRTENQNGAIPLNGEAGYGAPETKEALLSKNQTKEPTKEVEFLLLNTIDVDGFPPSTVWKAMVKNAKRQKPGKKFVFPDGTIGTIVPYPTFDKTEFRAVCFNRPITDAWFEQNGHIPLPPYIRREDVDSDMERYQTVYAKEVGSAAAPTAGLHFTPNMLDELQARGVEIVYVTLHVGLGTFLPVRTENIEEHKMHEEFFNLSPEAARTIENAKAQGRPILAVGTTSMRTLESAWNSEKGSFDTGTRSTSIFIYPGYTFKVVDKLFTNFHTPESTLLMLVSAFAGKDHVLSAYKEAVKNEYRFFSYGDAMLLE